MPPKLAGRILLKHANLTAIRYNALLSFDGVAAALRPLDRPDALLKPMTSSTMATVTLGGSTYWQTQDQKDWYPPDEEDAELLDESG